MFFIDIIKKIFIVVLTVAIGIFAFRFFGQEEKPAEPAKPPTQNVISEIPVTHDQQTSISYGARAPDDNAQVDISSKPPAVIVRANDKEYTMPSTVKETAAFENGQLKIKQETTAKIDVTQVVNEQMEQERKALLAKYNRPNELKASVLAGSSSFYVGAEYEAKMWDAGIYQRVAGDGDKRLIKGSATILRW